MNHRRECRNPDVRTMTRRTALIVAIGLLLALLLTACHQLVNPVDPNSTTYSGIPAGGDDPAKEPEPLLPSAKKWELSADHDPGRLLPLEITEDESFVEPRDAGSYELWITLSDSFGGDQADGAVLWISVTSFANTFYAVAKITDTMPELRRLAVRFDGGIPNETMIRLRLTDRNGTIIGERVFGRLIGDVDGNRLVDVVADHTEVVALAGFAVTTDDPGTIRADLDLNGLIEPNPGSDWDVVTSHGGESLPSSATEFWD
jgi:hypothetical protein